MRQKQKDNSARSSSPFDKGGATQRTRQSIYATAVAARFFFFFCGTVDQTNLLETINCIILYLRTSDVQCANSVQTTKTLSRLQLSAGSSEPKLLVHAIISVSRPMLLRATVLTGSNYLGLFGGSMYD